MSVFGRDIDTVDNQLADSLRMAAMVSPISLVSFYRFTLSRELTSISLSGTGKRPWINYPHRASLGSSPSHEQD